MRTRPHIRHVQSRRMESNQSSPEILREAFARSRQIGPRRRRSDFIRDLLVFAGRAAAYQRMKSRS